MVREVCKADVQHAAANAIVEFRHGETDLRVVSSRGFAQAQFRKPLVPWRPELEPRNVIEEVSVKGTPPVENGADPVVRDDAASAPADIAVPAERDDD